MAQPTDIELAYAGLSSKAAAYTTLWDYYLGNAPLTYTNQKLEEVFRNLDARFTENWASVVVDSSLDRINLGALTAEDTTADDALTALWDATTLANVSDDVHEAALVCGESFVVVWPNADGQPRAYFNDPRLCHVIYSDEDPYVVRYAAKWYDTSDGRRKLTLYYPDHLEYYISSGQAENIQTANAFQPDMEKKDGPQQANPYGEVPVFHFRPHRDIRSELANVVPMQNGINKLLADMIVAAEYGSFKQRYVISNADVGSLKNAPNEIWSLPAGDGAGQATTVGEFSPTDLMMYLDAIDRLAQHISTITRTPKHYFMSSGGVPSGEALIAMEAPLNKKCENLVQRFAPTWRQVGAFLLKLSGQSIGADAITASFDAVETVQPLTEAQIRAQSVQGRGSRHR